MPLPWPSSSQRQVWLLAGSRLPESRWISFACASLAPARSAGYIDARHRGLLLFTDITKANQSCSRQTLSSALVKCTTAEVYPVLGTLMLIIRHLLSPALHRGGHAQEGAHHSSADIKASNMQARRQHPSILAAQQLFAKVQDCRKALLQLGRCIATQHLSETTMAMRRAAFHLSLGTPCQPVQNPETCSASAETRSVARADGRVCWRSSRSRGPARGFQDDVQRQRKTLASSDPSPAGGRAGSAIAGQAPRVMDAAAEEPQT